MSAVRRFEGGAIIKSVNVGSLMLLLGGIAAVLSALLARHGFTGRDHVVGIDLGTTYSVVAILQKNEITPIADKDGHVLVPSTVAFLPDGGLLVGREARAYRTTDPQHTIFNAKRFIGQSYTDVMGSEANESGVVPYEFSVKKLENNDHDGVCFKLNLHNQPECVAPLEIGTAIVRHLRSMACQFVGHEQITKAVIAVPVDFNAKQRNATKAAFEAAGLVVSRILEEPTAAAIAYGLHQDPNVSFLLVFDFGGGTLDVSLLFARNDAITVLDTVGDNHLGGEDLDVQLSAWLVQQFEAQIGTAITSRGGTETYRTELAHGLNEPPCTLAGVRQVAELAKRQLSDETVTTAACAWSDRGQVVRPVVEITRSQFESLCLPLLERTMIPVLDILEANNMATDEIDAVVVVGGSSRIPWVLERLTDIFQGRAPLSDINPDLAVALGAARTLD